MAKTYTYEEMQKNLEFEEGATVKVTPEQLDELMDNGWELAEETDTEDVYVKKVNEFFTKRYRFILPQLKASSDIKEGKEFVEEETDTEIPEESPEMVNL
ncbi:hypothetical protein KAU11_11385 [Candidatus Babeliales bacterium]|nr:hypothetical protein [Candidatus Babeliales bacterium]